MSDLILREWKGKSIRQREDGYVSATDMCQTVDKKFNNWIRLDSTKEYLKALELRRCSDVSNGNLVEILQGGIPEQQGTWVYRKVALRLAQWLDPNFAIQVDEWVEEILLKGYTIDRPNINPERLQALESEIQILKSRTVVLDSAINKIFSSRLLPAQMKTWTDFRRYMETGGLGIYFSNDTLKEVREGCYFAGVNEKGFAKLVEQNGNIDYVLKLLYNVIARKGEGQPEKLLQLFPQIAIETNNDDDD